MRYTYGAICALRHENLYHIAIERMRGYIAFVLQIYRTNEGEYIAKGFMKWTIKQ